MAKAFRLESVLRLVANGWINWLGGAGFWPKNNRLAAYLMQIGAFFGHTTASRKAVVAIVAAKLA